MNHRLVTNNIVALNLWREEQSVMEVMVEGPRAVRIAAALHEREIPFSVALSDVESLMSGENKFNKRPFSGNRSSMDWTRYHRLDVIYKFMDDLVKEFPYICSVHSIGKSYEGRDLKIIRISNNNPENKAVWIDGAIHAREWITVSAVTYIADHLARNFDTCASSVTTRDWYILPVMNPDGYEYTHSIDRMWRKNRHRYGECIGVDLNRNFSYGWGERGEDGSSDDAGNTFFRGPEPFSEPESSAVRKFLMQCESTFEIFLSFHSYGEVVIFPWGYKSDPCPTYVELLDAGTSMSKAIFKTAGKIYRVGSTKDLMYYAAGTSIDWAYGILGIPFCFMLELRSRTHKFLLPKEEILETATEALNSVLSLADFVDKNCIPMDTADLNNVQYIS